MAAAQGQAHTHPAVRRVPGAARRLVLGILPAVQVTPRAAAVTALRLVVPLVHGATMGAV